MMVEHTKLWASHNRMETALRHLKQQLREGHNQHDLLATINRGLNEPKKD